mmetsp:Transcript_15459/g.50307  ORF Transcript_15459/g.50307 Transcript_15459/m.50307 type:complete len:668 (+) Transcript_15459:1-2004(+)
MLRRVRVRILLRRILRLRRAPRGDARARGARALPAARARRRRNADGRRRPRRRRPARERRAPRRGALRAQLRRVRRPRVPRGPRLPLPFGVVLRPRGHGRRRPRRAARGLGPRRLRPLRRFGRGRRALRPHARPRRVPRRGGARRVPLLRHGVPAPRAAVPPRGLRGAHARRRVAPRRLPEEGAQRDVLPQRDAALRPARLPDAPGRRALPDVPLPHGAAGRAGLLAPPRFGLRRALCARRRRHAARRRRYVVRGPLAGRRDLRWRADRPRGPRLRAPGRVPARGPLLGRRGVVRAHVRRALGGLLPHDGRRAAPRAVARVRDHGGREPPGLRGRAGAPHAAPGLGVARVGRRRLWDPVHGRLPAEPRQRLGVAEDLPDLLRRARPAHVRRAVVRRREALRRRAGAADVVVHARLPLPAHVQARLHRRLRGGAVRDVLHRPGPRHGPQRQRVLPPHDAAAALRGAAVRRRGLRGAADALGPGAVLPGRARRRKRRVPRVEPVVLLDDHRRRHGAVHAVGRGVEARPRVRRGGGLPRVHGLARRRRRQGARRRRGRRGRRGPRRARGRRRGRGGLRRRARGGGDGGVAGVRVLLRAGHRARAVEHAEPRPLAGRVVPEPLDRGDRGRRREPRQEAPDGGAPRRRAARRAAHGGAAHAGHGPRGLCGVR